MTSNASVQFHMRFVTEKHRELIGSLDELVNILVSELIDEKKLKADVSLSKAKDLKSSISQEDSPQWLPSLIEVLNNFANGIWKQQKLINHLINNIKTIKEHEWIFDTPSETAFDFDSIFQRYKSESRLPELFDEIIRILEEIQNSGEVDSVAMLSALGKVIATLKRNKDGSFFSLNSAWSFLVSFLKNYMWAELSKLPVLGTAMEALEKTISETNEEMFEVHGKIQKEMETMVESEVKGLSKKSEFTFIGYDRTGAQLPRLPNNAEISESV